MIARERPYTIDLNHDGTEDRWDGPLTYGDKNADKIVATLNRGGVAATLETATAMLYGVRSDGTTAFKAGTIAGNVVSVEMDYPFYAVPGRMLLLLQVSEGTDDIRTPLRVTTYVKDGATDELVSTGERFSLAEIQAAISACQTATAAATDAASSASSAASSATTAAGNATTQAAAAQAAAAAITGITASAQTLDAGAEATAAVSNAGGVKHMTFGIPRGPQGNRGSWPWYGTAITGNSTVPAAYATGFALVQVGDTYIYTGTDTANAGNEYVCTLGGDAATALWRYLRNSRGAPGTGSVSYVDGMSPDVDGDVPLGAIRYNAAQPELTDAERAQARANAGAASVAQALPTGGAVGQALVKSSATDYATEWAAVGRTNPNLLIDWDWRYEPVNQRGLSGDISSGYVYDMVKRSAGTITIASGYLSIPANAAVIMPIEGNGLAGKTVCVSVMIGNTVYSGTGAFPTSAGTTSVTITGLGTATLTYASGYMAVTFAADESTRNVQAVKLELGTVSTLANDAPADYGEQLAICQRYYLPIANYTPFAALHYSGNGAFQCLVITPVTMRTLPTLIGSNLGLLYLPSYAIVPTTATPLQLLKSGIKVNLAEASMTSLGHTIAIWESGTDNALSSEF